MSPSDDADGGRADPTPAHFKRLHPVTPLIKGWAYLVAGIAFGGQDAIRSGEGGRFGLIIVAVAVIGIVAGTVSWWFTRYGFDGDALRIDSGVLAKRSRRVRLDRLQAVDINRPLAGRLLGVSELRLEVAGGSSSEAPLQFLAADDAIRLRAELLARAAGIASDTPEAPERLIHEVPLRRLVWSTVLSGAFVFGVVLLLAVGVAFAFVPDVLAAAVPSLIPGLFGIGAAIWQQLGRNFGFVLAESPDGFRIRKGLLDTRHQTVPPGRIQGVLIRQPPLWRLKDWVMVDVEVAGYASGTSMGVQQTSTLTPVAPREEAAALLRQVIPGADPYDVLLDPAPKRAMWLRPIGWWRLAFGVNDRVVVVREGVLWRRLTVVLHAKTQSVRVTQGPWQRRLGVASAHVDTTPGPVRATILHRGGNQARDFVEAQAERARSARKADVPEQWMAEPVRLNAVMPESTSTPRSVADRYVETIADLNPIVGTQLGIRPGSHALPDFSPEGHAEVAAAQRATLAELDAAEDHQEEHEARAARLLRERLTASLAVHESGDELRALNNLFTPVHSVRSVFLLMPTESDDDWAVIARRMRNVPDALGSYEASLRAGAKRGLFAAPRQVEAVAGQLGEWVDGDWFTGFVADGPQTQRDELTSGARLATEAVSNLRAYLSESYLPAAEGSPDAVGRDRYGMWVRQWTGADLDLDEAYAYGWDEFHRLLAEMREAAQQVRLGATPTQAMEHLNDHGDVVEGVDEVRDWLQAIMDGAMRDLDGTHFDLADPIKRVEAMIAPPGSAAAPYYTRPSLDFERPGRTWLPTMGSTRFPTWDLVSVWYHEGVPGHHLQLAQWVHVADKLSRYQVSLGSVSATTEGWALYAERLMDELGYLTDPAVRLGYLDAQMLRAIRVVIDIGMHLELAIPQGAEYHPGETWTPDLAREFCGTYLGSSPDFLDSEIVRYLGVPGQAISYKLGERAWLRGRSEAKAAAGTGFDLKAWHMAALSLGSLGLDDLADELSRLP